MGAPIPLWVRKRVIEDHQAGVSASTIAERHKLSRSSVYGLVRRYKEKNLLAADYSACGRPRTTARIYRAARYLKYLHRSWGAPLIRALLQARYGEVPSTRTMQRWFKAAKLTEPREKRPVQSRARAGEIHGCWQIDAKERLPAKACYLTIVDEYSGACLAAPVFSLFKDQSGTASRDQDKAD